MKVDLKKLMQSIKNKKSADTIYVSNPKDPRLKKYKDSLALYKQSVKSVGGEEEIVKSIFREEDRYNQWVKKQPKEKQKELRKLETEVRTPNLVKSKTVKGIKPAAWRGMMAVTDDPSTWEDAMPFYAKPKQPVEYRKPQPKKEEVVKKQEVVKKAEPVVERKQNVYEGTPIYSPGAGSGLGSALIGFRNKKGDTTYISPEDFVRFAVPSYGKKYIESKTKNK